MTYAPLNKKIRVVVAGKVPPPVGGQNINIARVLRLLGMSDRIEALYWEWGFTKNWASRGRLGVGKAVELVKVAGRLLKLRFGGSLDFLLYSTGGPDLVPIFRDIVLLPLACLCSKKVCVYFQAAGIADKQVNLPPFVNRLNRWANGLCWGAVVITEFGVADAKALGFENITVLPYGIEDQAGESQAKEPLATPKPAPILLNVGHLCADKGTPQLIAACGMLHRKGYDLSLRLAGECLRPYSVAQMNEDIEKAGLAEKVEYVGLLGGEALWQAYRQADLFIFSTQAPYESFGLVLLEAMMMGLPVVVTDWRANIEVLGHNGSSGGIIVSSDVQLPFEERLEIALETALASRELWSGWGSRNRARYLQLFSSDIYQKRLEAFFVTNNES